MSADIETVVGIDVGGERKGFHAVALQNKVFEKTTSPNPHKILDWCLHRKAKIVAVESSLRLESLWPVAASGAGTEIRQERNAPPLPRRHAPKPELTPKDFLIGCLMGEKLYQLLAPQYPLFVSRKSPCRPVLL